MKAERIGTVGAATCEGACVAALLSAIALEERPPKGPFSVIDLLVDQPSILVKALATSWSLSA